MKPIDTEGNQLAGDSFQRAIDIDPSFAKAFAGLAWSNWLHHATINYYSDERKALAFSLAKKSISLGDNALARRTLAKQHYRFVGDGNVAGGDDLEQALSELRAAHELEPNNADILADFASLLALGDKAEEGLHHVERAMELNPEHPEWYAFAKGINLLFVGRFNEAADAIRRYIQINPTWDVSYIFLAIALVLDDNQRLAKIALDQFEKRGNMSTFKANQSALLRRFPMASQARNLFVEGLTILKVPKAAN